MLAVPVEIGREGIGIEGIVLEKSADRLGGLKVGFGELAELGDEILNRDLFGRRGHGYFSFFSRSISQRSVS